MVAASVARPWPTDSGVLRTTRPGRRRLLGPGGGRLVLLVVPQPAGPAAVVTPSQAQNKQPFHTPPRIGSTQVVGIDSEAVSDLSLLSTLTTSRKFTFRKLKLETRPTVRH